MGYSGLAELQKFVRAGGMLITMKESTRLMESGFVRELNTLPPGNLFHPGSIVRAKVRRTDHPIMYGFPEITHIFRGNAPLYSLAKRDRSMMLLQYGTKPLKDEQQEKDEGAMLGIPAPAPAPAPAAPAPPAPAPRPATAPATATADDYVLSGMVKNPEVIVGHGAVFDIPLGKGHVIAFTFNPLHRWLNHHEFPLVWNALMHWNDLPAGK
jgi:hypothetical protein